MTTAEKLQKIAENEQKVYEAGKQAQYDAFWDAYQDYGNRRNYLNAFYGDGWTDETCDPKYDITAGTNGCNLMFGYSKVANIKRTIDLTQATSTSYLFHSSRVETIHKIKLSETTPIKGWFDYAYYVVHIGIEGIIGQNGLNLQWAGSLSHDSIVNIINALSNTPTGQPSVVFSKIAVNNAFETSKGAADGSSSSEWLDLIEPKRAVGWTFSLIGG